MCDRALILKDGATTKIINNTDISKERIVMYAATGIQAMDGQ